MNTKNTGMLYILYVITSCGYDIYNIPVFYSNIESHYLFSWKTSLTALRPRSTVNSWLPSKSCNPVTQTNWLYLLSWIAKQ